MRIKDLERFASKLTIVSSGCWEWQREISHQGYGRFFLVDRRYPAHRVIYEAVNNVKVPTEMHMDHLCRNRKCVNPKHVEPVTPRENYLRGTSPAALNARKTHCKNGHEFTPENTYISYSKGTRGRDCFTCKRRAKARFEQRRKELVHGQA